MTKAPHIKEQELDFTLADIMLFHEGFPTVVPDKPHTRQTSIKDICGQFVNFPRKMTDSCCLKIYEL